MEINLKKDALKVKGLNLINNTLLTKRKWRFSRVKNGLCRDIL